VLERRVFEWALKLFDFVVDLGEVMMG